MSSCAALEVLTPTLVLWLWGRAGAEDLLPSGHAWKQPISLSPFQFSFSIQSWSEFIWSETLAFFPCVYLPVWLAQYVFHFPGSFGISLKSD